MANIKKEGIHMDQNTNNFNYPYYLSQFFVNKNERLISTLGNSYIQNFISTGILSKGFSFITDKRVYFQGKSYNVFYNNSGNPKIVKNSRSQIVDLKDVTGTEIKHYNPIHYLIIAIVFFIGLIFTLSFGRNFYIFGYYIIPIILAYVFLYFKNKISLISIQYAGGEIAFDIRWFSQNEIDNFQKQLRLAKDNVVDNPINNNHNTSSADELIKYGQLLQKGLISPEEYQNIKRNLL